MSVQIGSAYGKIVVDSSGVRSGVDGATKSLGQFEQNTKSLADGIAGALGFITAEVALLKKAFDFGREGASVAQLKESFGTMLNAMGAAPDLLKKLHAASMGTVSDYQLMSSTAMLLAGTQGELATALANAAPELLEMANVAQKLNPALGDTTFLYDSLARGIKRGSPLILDNLGIIVKLEEAYKKYADSIGKSADELTVEEQKIGLLNEVLAQKEILMKQAGGNADSMTDSYERLSAATENITNEFKSWIGQGMTPAAEALFILMTWQKKVNEVMEESSDVVRANSKSYGEYLLKTLDLLVLSGKMHSSTRQEINDRMAAGESIDFYTDRWELLTLEQWQAIRAGKELANYIDGPLRRALSANEQAVDGQTVAIQHAGKAANLTRGDMAKYSIELGRSAAAAREAEAAQNDLDQAMGDLKTMVGGELMSVELDFIETQDELAEKIEKLKGKIEELEGKKYLTQKQKEELLETQEELGKLDVAYANNATAHEERTKRILFDMLMERAAMEGLTSDEMSLLTQVAEQWGLIDEDSRLAIGGIDKALNDLANGKSLEEVQAELEALLSKIQQIGGDHPITFHSQVFGPVPNIPGSIPGVNAGPDVTMAAGGSFVVPPGYPNDSFMMALSSGEGVDVTPAGSGGNGGPQTVNYVTQNLNMSFGAGAGNNLRRDASRAAAITKALIWSD